MRDEKAKGYPLADHEGHARSVPTDAYWKQVRRTINGEPASDAQIALIVTAIGNGLALTRDDMVLDLACGNGALSACLFDKCAALAGVDISPYLIDIAQRDFARPPRYRFGVDDVLAYVERTPEASRFTKVLIYGAFQYFARNDAGAMLAILRKRFPAVTKVFIGNLPDRRHVDRFYRDRAPTSSELDDNEARIGIWYLPEEVERMAAAAGWRAACSCMPPAFYASSYRFDVTLEPPGA